MVVLGGVAVSYERGTPVQCDPVRSTEAMVHTRKLLCREICSIPTRVQVYTVTSLIRHRAPLGPYIRPKLGPYGGPLVGGGALSYQRGTWIPRLQENAPPHRTTIGS